jgi:hypothetical protein
MLSINALSLTAADRRSLQKNGKAEFQMSRSRRSEYPAMCENGGKNVRSFAQP